MQKVGTCPVMNDRLKIDMAKHNAGILEGYANKLIFAKFKNRRLELLLLPLLIQIDAS